MRGVSLGPRCELRAKPVRRVARGVVQHALGQEQEAALGGGHLDGRVDDVGQQQRGVQLGIQAPAEGQEAAQLGARPMVATMSPRSAPSAVRTPISRVRRDTVNAMIA